ncbi:natural resistance associated macrophage protein [Tribonema minus]|uniref:Natural resistance associated macrophage protein n=1 Tax=Tribonema minus TaxID=303371 RepID=A0A835YXD1_9STRA|nr:natural resistance associated macrophage protein [Tribonema minus]
MVTLELPAAGAEAAETKEPDSAASATEFGESFSHSSSSAEENQYDNMQSTVKVPDASSKWHAKARAFAGVGFMVSVGYMDPGNWATDLAAGAKYGYTLLTVVLASSLIAMFLQSLALKLGVATDRDLAQACRHAYRPAVSRTLCCLLMWCDVFLRVLMELAIAATDLAELIGSATALYLLFRIPIWAGVLITGVDVLLILMFSGRSMRIIEAIVFLMVALIAACFAVQLAAVQPNWSDVGRGFIPSGQIVTDPDVLYLAIGIMGATVMPHNLFLHSSSIQTRAYPRDDKGRAMAVRYGRIDVMFALLCAFYVNAAILILSAAAFHYSANPNKDITDITEAYKLLTSATGQRGAEILFGISLLASGQSSSITGTLSGQIVMGGFVNMRIKPWQRRLITRSIAMIPAAIVAAVSGNKGAGQLLVLSQVILSLTLTFAVVPLVHITSTRAKMGRFVNNWVVTIIAAAIATIIGGLNFFLVIQAIRSA